ncbi:synaptotagmin-9 [Hydra vulgaris]|uniref:Synaptotagmin-9 n=1 Tax=Hydra vulgaris TaxID=6087 RepID=A0ABM4DNR8_HYDVU
MSLTLMWLLVAGSLFLALDFLIFVAYIIWRQKKRKDKEIKTKDEVENLIDINPNEMTKKNMWINMSDSDGFLIPCKTIEINGDKRRLRPKKIPFTKEKEDGYLDATQYDYRTRKRQNGIPMVSFELFYRIGELKVIIRKGKQLTGDRFSISVMLSNSTLSYNTSYVNGPDPVFNETFRFPLQIEDISADPPVQLKLNIWSLEKLSEEKKPFGLVKASVEEILIKYGLMPAQGKGIVWENIERCTTLIENQQGNLSTEVFIHLGYLSAARRIVVLLSEVKNLILKPNDKLIVGVISLIYRDSEKKTFTSTGIKAESNIKFREEFVFHLSEFPNLGIDGLAICIELQAIQKKLLLKPRILGSVTVGNSEKAERTGREHWARMLTSGSSVSKWHTIQEPYVLVNN